MRQNTSRRLTDLPVQKINYRPDIDGLRAVAVLSVLGYHAFPGYFPGGFFGVDVFFVLSGYLITSVLFAHSRGAWSDFGEFYARRIRRIFPGAITVIAVTGAAGFLLLFPHEYRRLAAHIWASLFFVENILLARETGYFDVEAAGKPLLHYWSLAVEEQFYLLWPVLLVPFARSAKMSGLLIATILITSFVIAAFEVFTPTWNFYSPVTRAWELASGAALTWYVRNHGLGWLSARPAIAGFLSLGALALLTGAIFVSPHSHTHPGWVTLIPVLATATLLATGPTAFGNARLLALRPAVGIGLISYPLYLWHWPLLSYAFIVAGDRGSTLLRLSLLAAAVVLAWGTYRWIERPLRFSWPRRRAIQMLLAGTFLVALASLIPLWVVPSAGDKAQAMAEDQIEGVAWRYTSNVLCKQKHREHFTAFCMQAGDRDPALFFFGNSYANHLFPGVVETEKFKGLPALAFGTCEASRKFPFGIYGKDQCDDQLRMLKEYSSIKLVIVGNQWSLFDRSGRMTDLQPGDPGKPSEYPDAEGYRQGLRETFALLAARGVPVVIFGPKPELGYNIADCYGRPLRPATKSCIVNREAFDRQAAVTVEILRGFAREFPNIHYFDLTPLFCGAEKCSYRAANGTPYLRDGNGHFSVAGSKYVADQFMLWAEANHIQLPR